MTKMTMKLRCKRRLSGDRNAETMQPLAKATRSSIMEDLEDDRESKFFEEASSSTVVTYVNASALQMHDDASPLDCREDNDLLVVDPPSLMRQSEMEIDLEENGSVD